MIDSLRFQWDGLTTKVTTRASCAKQMKWIGRRATFVYIQAKSGQENLLRMVRWHCPLDTGFEILSPEVGGSARRLSVTDAPHNSEFYEWMGMKHFCLFQTARPGNEPRAWAGKAAVLTTTPPAAPSRVRPGLSHLENKKRSPIPGTN